MANINIKLTMTRPEPNRKEGTGGTEQNSEILLTMEFLGKYHRIGRFTLAEIRLLLGSEDSDYQGLQTRVRSTTELDTVYTISKTVDFETKLRPWMKKYSETAMTNLTISE